MKGDFTRDTFDATKRFSRVLMQQGRVQLDADWNEQTSILLHYLRTLAADLIGPHGGPGEGFAIEALTDENGDPILHNFGIKAGHYYVDGILCENDRDVTFQKRDATVQSQPNYPYDEPMQFGNGQYLVYLDAWERHICHLEDEDEQGDEPGIREVALGGPDTATRARVVWQVKVAEYEGGCPDGEGWKELVETWQPERRGSLRARAKAPQDPADLDPCVTPPESRYRGTENQLYRVEIHRGGIVGQGDTPTFKWSRENGSVVFPIVDIEGDIVTLRHLGKDDHLGLRVDDWVELVEDGLTLRGEPGPLRQVVMIDRDNRQVTLSEGDAIAVGQREDFNHPLLRRWDQQQGDPTQGGLELDEGGVRIKQAHTDPDENWLHLEDGVQVQFVGAGHEYRSGDYWLIPARTATGDVEWPGTTDVPARRGPHGIEHHYAPLAIISVNNGAIADPTSCRKTLSPLTAPAAEQTTS